jgi:Uma2 family endonuclease
MWIIGRFDLEHWCSEGLPPYERGVIFMVVAEESAWLRPPQDGFVAEDLDRIPELPPHTELIDGSLVFAAPWVSFHMRALRLLEQSLCACAPAHVAVQREMTVKLGPRQRLEPDIMVTRASAERELSQTMFLARDTVLVVEVVSAESRERDLHRKPSLYAEAGIVHFWLVENVDDRMVVYVYERDPATGSYGSTGTYHRELTVRVPFPISIDLTALTRRRA